MPKTKRKNRKLRNKKRTRKIYQEGGAVRPHHTLFRIIFSNIIPNYKELYQKLTNIITHLTNITNDHGGRYSIDTINIVINGIDNFNSKELVSNLLTYFEEIKENLPNPKKKIKDIIIENNESNESKVSNIKYEYLQKDFDATYMNRITASGGIHRPNPDYQVKEISISYTGTKTGERNTEHIVDNENIEFKIGDDYIGNDIFVNLYSGGMQPIDLMSIVTFIRDLANFVGGYNSNWNEAKSVIEQITGKQAPTSAELKNLDSDIKKIGKIGKKGKGSERYRLINGIYERWSEMGKKFRPNNLSMEQISPQSVALASVKNDPRAEGYMQEFNPPSSASSDTSSASSDRSPPFIPPPPVKPPPNKPKPQGATKTGGIEMREYTCSTHPNKEMCLRVPNKCQWNPVKNECKDIPPKFTEGYNLSELQKSLKMKINRLLTKNFKETRDINFLKIEKILNYRNNPDAWLPVKMDDRLHRELLILELLKTTKKIKELLATARTASERPANINKLDEAILQVQSEIQLLTGDLQLAIPNVPNDPEDNTTGESKGTIQPPPRDARPIRPKNEGKPPRRRKKGERLFADEYSSGMLAYPIGSKEAELAAAAGPDATGLDSTKLDLEVEGEEVPGALRGSRPTAIAYPEAQAIKDKVDEIRPACTVEIMPVPKLKGADNKNKKKKKKKREETKQACEEKGGEVVKVDKKNVTCKKCPVNDLLELIKELEIRRQ